MLITQLYDDVVACLARLDIKIQQEILEGRLKFNIDLDESITEVYRSLGGLSRYLPCNTEEVKEILVSREIDAEILPIEDLLPKVRGNPDPERYGW